MIRNYRIWFCRCIMPDTFSNTPITKIIENHNGHAYIEQMQQIQARPRWSAGRQPPGVARPTRAVARSKPPAASAEPDEERPTYRRFCHGAWTAQFASLHGPA